MFVFCFLFKRRPVTDETGEQEATFLRFHNTEMQVMNLAVEVEKDKMTELVQVLQERSVCCEV